MPTAFSRYLLGFCAVAVSVLLLVWLYVLSVPMAFLEGGYPNWVAKSEMLRQCQVGRIAFFGDSRLHAAVVPALLPVEASNFALAAGTAVETQTAVRRAVRCATPPRQVVLSLTARHFGPLDRYFWLNDLRYGFIAPGDLLAAENLAASLGDTQSFTATRTPDGLSGRLRDWLYEIRFPSLYFSSLVQAHGFGRAGSNRARLALTLQARGYTEYASAAPADADQAEPAGFIKTPLQQAEFEQTLALLRAQDIDVALLFTPASQAARADAQRDTDYLAYIGTLTRRFSNVHLVNATIPSWPAFLFADGEHLNGAGARAFSQRLASCVVDGRLGAGCDLEWRGEK